MAQLWKYYKIRPFTSEPGVAVPTAPTPKEPLTQGELEAQVAADKEALNKLALKMAADEAAETEK